MVTLIICVGLLFFLLIFYLFPQINENFDLKRRIDHGIVMAKMLSLSTRNCNFVPMDPFFSVKKSNQIKFKKKRFSMIDFT